MKKLLFAAFVLTPALALAGSQPYVLYNGRRGGGSGGAPAGRSYGQVATPAPAFVRAAPTRTFFGARGAAAPIRVYTSGYRGFSSGATSRTSSRHSFANATPLRLNHVVRRGVMSATGGTTPAGGSSGGADQTPPPNYTKPGALIRTEGQLPVYSNAGPVRQHSVEAGGFIAQNDGKAHDAARSPGVTWGRPDTLPPATPDSGGGSVSGSGISANGPTITVNNNTQNGASGNVNGNQGGNGHENGNPHGTGFDPSF